MPRTRPVLDYTQIRNYAEQFIWTDPRSGLEESGFNPPSNAIDPRHKPFSITFLTEDGVPYHGRAVCVGVNTARRTRRLQFVEEAHIVGQGGTKQGSSTSNNSALLTPHSSLFKSISKGEIRQVADILIVEIDGVRFSSH